MVDLVIIAASVVADASANRVAGQAGEAITAGQAVYLDPTVKKWLKADSNAATAAALVAGSTYFLSETPGGIQPAADLGTGEDVCMLGIARSSTVLALSIQAPGVTL